MWPSGTFSSGFRGANFSETVLTVDNYQQDNLFHRTGRVVVPADRPDAVRRGSIDALEYPKGSSVTRQSSTRVKFILNTKILKNPLKV